MYRLLEVGEVIEKGDEFWMNSTRQWVIASYSVGARVKSCDGPQRRLVTPAASSVPDPGEGWRLLAEGELVEKGDEFLHTNGKWIKSYNWQEKHPKQGEQCDIVAYRRKLPAQPAPVVSVGDRVKVLSGPWAGCTGVVTLLDKWNQWNTDVSVLLDHVRVGGEQLGLVSPIREVEPLPPVVPEVLYRDLSHGETIRDGDEVWQYGQGPWLSVNKDSHCWGDTVSRLSARIRRPVRLQSQGWRYLDAGETVQAGDETFCENVGFWPLSIVNGSQVNNERMFRRKLPANQGG